jgi:hypothetical protein
LTDGNGGIAFAPFRDGETRSLIHRVPHKPRENGRTPENCFGVLFYGFLKRKIPGRTGSFGFPSPASLRRGTGKAFQAVHAVPFMIFSTDEGTGGQAAKVFFNPFLPFLFLCRQTG